MEVLAGLPAAGAAAPDAADEVPAPRAASVPVPEAQNPYDWPDEEPDWT